MTASTSVAAGSIAPSVAAIVVALRMRQRTPSMPRPALSRRCIELSGPGVHWREISSSAVQRISIERLTTAERLPVASLALTSKR